MTAPTTTNYNWYDYYTGQSACLAYNAGASSSGLSHIPDFMERTFKNAEPERAADTLTTLIGASDQMCKWGYALAEKAQELLDKRPELKNDEEVKSYMKQLKAVLRHAQEATNRSE